MFNFDFSDLSPKQEVVKYDGQVYILQEASEGAAVEHRNATVRSAKFSEAGKVIGVKDPADLEPALVGKCLFKTNEEGKILYGKNGLPVTIEMAVLNKWPARIVKQLFDWIKKASLMDETETEESIQDEIIKLNQKLEEMRKEKYPTKDTTDTSN